MDLSNQNKFFTFLLENKLHGINKKDIDSFLPYENLFQLAKCPHFIKGFLVSKKQLVPVIDLKIKLNLPETVLTRKTKILIVNCYINEVKVKVGALIDKHVEPDEIIKGTKNINIINISELIDENDYLAITNIVNNNLKKLKQKSLMLENIKLSN